MRDGGRAMDEKKRERGKKEKNREGMEEKKKGRRV